MLEVIRRSHSGRWPIWRALAHLRVGSILYEAAQWQPNRPGRVAYSVLTWNLRELGVSWQHYPSARAARRALTALRSSGPPPKDSPSNQLNPNFADEATATSPEDARSKNPPKLLAAKHACHKEPLVADILNIVHKKRLPKANVVALMTSYSYGTGWKRQPSWSLRKAVQSFAQIAPLELVRQIRDSVAVVSVQGDPYLKGIMNRR